MKTVLLYAGIFLLTLFICGVICFWHKAKKALPYNEDEE